MEIEAPLAKVFRWAVAFALVMTIEGGAIAWVLMPPPIDDTESQTGGAFILELSPVTASPDEELLNAAVGKKSDEVKAVDASTPQKQTEVEPQPDEKQPPLPVLSEPHEDATPKPPDEKPPEEVKPPEETQAQNEAPSVAPVAASEAAAPQKIDNAPEKSDTPRGQNVGLSRIDRVAIQNWQRDLLVHINRFKRYPAKARETRTNSVVMVSFTLDRQGRLVRYAVSKGAGNAELDQAAIDMLQHADPLPAPPPNVSGETIDFVLPVQFRWRE